MVMLQVKKSCLKVQQHQLPEEERGHKQGLGVQQLHLPHPWEDEKAQVAYVMVMVMLMMIVMERKLWKT